ncbi:hypothetical protein C2845_PM11G23380 [Panicum miliaceum]|uniref:Uncharacterized protein n=1 Tax=Panicum miliaceum TaxID=4540 RepID=A0A3L6RVB3_PANMI|nr:hypothetical protein C2845_PM11G23380 [Panicum miliaceum]
MKKKKKYKKRKLSEDSTVGKLAKDFTNEPNNHGSKTQAGSGNKDTQQPPRTTTGECSCRGLRG